MDIKVDKRTEKTTGKYSTRDALEEAVLELASKWGDWSLARIAKKTGTSTTTVLRIVRDDKAKEHEPPTPHAELVDKLNELWKPTDVPVEPEEIDEE